MPLFNPVWRSSWYSEVITKEGELRRTRSKNPFIQWRCVLTWQQFYYDRKAVKLYTEAVAQGYARAMYNLALCYDFGTSSTPPSLLLTVRVFILAGEGVTQDIPKSVDLYHKSAQRGYAVGMCTILPWKINKQTHIIIIVIVFEWSSFSHTAQHYMGVCYYHGKGTKMDLSKAIDMWRRAALQGHPYAISCMGESFRDGQGVVRYHTWEYLVPCRH